jgi:hypothetical protein
MAVASPKGRAKRVLVRTALANALTEKSNSGFRIGSLPSKLA